MLRQGVSSHAVNQFDGLPQSTVGGSGIDLPRPSQQPRAEHGGHAPRRQQEMLLICRFNRQQREQSIFGHVGQRSDHPVDATKTIEPYQTVSSGSLGNLGTLTNNSQQIADAIHLGF